MMLSNNVARRIGRAVKQIEANPVQYGQGHTQMVNTSPEVFCQALVVDPTGPVVLSGSQYDLTNPVVCRRLVEDNSKGLVIRIDATQYDAVEVQVTFDGTTAGTFIAGSDAEAAILGVLAAAGATDVSVEVIGKYIYISESKIGEVDVITSGPVVARCTEWPLGEEENFFLSQIPSTDLTIGDLVNVHFSESLGGLIVPRDAVTESDPCCTNTVVNSTDLQIDIPEYNNGVATGGTRTLNTTKTWVAEIKRDITFSVDGGFARLLSGSYPLIWSAVTETWSRDASGDLIFLDEFGRVVEVGVASATLVMAPDDGAGNVALAVNVDADFS